MTFDQIVAAVADKMGITASNSLDRIRDNVNMRYRTICSTLGLEMVDRGTVTATLSTSSRTVTFIGIERLDAVYDYPSDDTDQRERVYTERPYNFIRFARPLNNISPEYAIEKTTGNSIRILLGATPSGDETTVYADGMVTVPALSGAMVPAFAATFHDVLEYGARADEYDQKEDKKGQQIWEMKFEKRKAELIHQHAVSTFLKFNQSDRYTPIPPQR